MKRGFRVVHADKELLEKLVRNDPCLVRRKFEVLSSALDSMTAPEEITFFRE